MIHYQQSWSFRTSALLVMVITVTLHYLSLWYNFHFLLLIQVKPRVLDQVYMVMIILHFLVLLHDFELSPTRPPLWCLLHRCLFHLYLPTPYHLRCSWWWLLYYIVSIDIIIHVISILKSIFWYNINYHDHFVHLRCWWWWLLWLHIICPYDSIFILFWFKSSHVYWIKFTWWWLYYTF